MLRLRPTAVLLPVLALLLAACSGDQTPSVQTAEVGRADVSEVVDAPGSVAARATATLTAPAAATVAALLVKDGQQVASGAVLARLSSPEAQERLRQAVASRRSASATAVDVQRADLGPLQDSLDDAARQSFAAGRAAAKQIADPAARAGALRQVEDAELRYETTAAAARSALDAVGDTAEGIGQALAAVTGSQRVQAAAAVDVARATVDALVVRAPIAGVVSFGGAGAAPAAGGGDLAGLIAGLPAAVQGPAAAALGGGAGPATASTTVEGLVVGQAVESGAPLLTVTDLGGLTVTAEVDETDVLLVKPGTLAVVEVDAVPDAQYTATVRAVDLASTSSAGGGVTYRVRLELGAGVTADEQPAPAPRPGMSAVVDLQVRTAKQAVAVPSAAVVRDEGRDVVFLVQAGKVVRREVRLGAQGEDLVEVLTGLVTGDRVVTRDADRLSDGQAVQS